MGYSFSIVSIFLLFYTNHCKNVVMQPYKFYNNKNVSIIIAHLSKSNAINIHMLMLPRRILYVLLKTNVKTCCVNLTLITHSRYGVLRCLKRTKC